MIKRSKKKVKLCVKWVGKRLSTSRRTGRQYYSKFHYGQIEAGVGEFICLPSMGTSAKNDVAKILQLFEDDTYLGEPYRMKIKRMLWPEYLPKNCTWGEKELDPKFDEFFEVIEDNRDISNEVSVDTVKGTCEVLVIPSKGNVREKVLNIKGLQNATDSSTFACKYRMNSVAGKLSLHYVLDSSQDGQQRVLNGIGNISKLDKPLDTLPHNRKMKDSDIIANLGDISHEDYMDAIFSDLLEEISIVYSPVTDSISRRLSVTQKRSANDSLKSRQNEESMPHNGKMKDSDIIANLGDISDEDYIDTIFSDMLKQNSIVYSPVTDSTSQFKVLGEKEDIDSSSDNELFPRKHTKTHKENKKIPSETLARSPVTDSTSRRLSVTQKRSANVSLKSRQSKKKESTISDSDYGEVLSKNQGYTRKKSNKVDTKLLKSHEPLGKKENIDSSSDNELFPRKHTRTHKDNKKKPSETLPGSAVCLSPRNKSEDKPKT